jgi:hypothetical protein
MKMKKITLGMSFGNYWNDTGDIEQRDSKPDEQATINTDSITSLTG